MCLILADFEIFEYVWAEVFPLFCVFEKPWNFGSHQPLSTLIVILSGLEPELAGPVMRDGVLGSTLVS